MASLVPEEEEMGILEQYAKYNPVTFLLQFVAAYGWYVVGAIGLAVLVYKKLKPAFDKYNLIQQDADHHKDPDRELSRMEAIQRAREKQQQLLEQASQRALEAQKEREERKRAERAEALEKYGAAVTGRKLGGSDDGYLPLSGGASASTYRPPKKSKCSGGGCGK
ncbi:uncharacterized protein LOC101746338 [Bombyx mori]|uniref:Selenoprotein S n=1 Tax=Bombyx mori TaxID=7091 RepID=A0A8R2AHM9_BOMMO|nr:uncharacterized protein LOC101746338 [Bombyx mori]